MPTTAKALLRAKPNQFAKPVNKPQKEPRLRSTKK
jgi:hypothetical protein